MGMAVKSGNSTIPFINRTLTCYFWVCPAMGFVYLVVGCPPVRHFYGSRSLRLSLSLPKLVLVESCYFVLLHKSGNHLLQGVDNPNRNPGNMSQSSFCVISVRHCLGKAFALVLTPD